MIPTKQWLKLCLVFASLAGMVVLMDSLSLLGTSRVTAMVAGVVALLAGAGFGLIHNPRKAGREG